MNIPAFFKYSVFVTVGLCLSIALFGFPFGYFLICLGGMPFAFSIAMLIDRAMKTKQYDKTDALVTSLVEKQEQIQGSSYSAYYPIISFNTYLEKKMTVQLTEGISPPPNVGTILRIGYNPEDPTEVIIIDSNYVIESIFGGVGLLFIAVGICFVV